MIFFIFFYMVLQVLVLVGVLALVGALLGRLLIALQRRGVGRWLLAPFRAWTGMDETRRPKP